jgi:hypothetical protein
MEPIMSLRTFAARYWRVLFYAALIVGSVLLAPQEVVKFIYTEF